MLPSLCHHSLILQNHLRLVVRQELWATALHLDLGRWLPQEEVIEKAAVEAKILIKEMSPLALAFAGRKHTVGNPIVVE